MAYQGPSAFLTSALVIAASVTLLACNPPPTHQKEKVGKSDKEPEPDEPKIKVADAKEVPEASLSKIVEGGSDWNTDGYLILDGPIIIRFDPMPEKPRRFDWTFDRDDYYLVGFLKGDEVVGKRLIHVTDNHGHPKGMWRSDHNIPKEVRKEGFDAVYIVGYGGNGKYSIGHFNLIEDVAAFKKEREAGRRARKASKNGEPAPAAKPIEAKPAEAPTEAPTDTAAPADAVKPDAETPTETPTDAAKPADAKTADAKTADAKPADAKKDAP